MIAGVAAVGIDSKVQQRMDALCNTSAKHVLAEYYRERLQAKQQQLMSCSKETFEVHKGRCLELVDLLNDLKL